MKTRLKECALANLIALLVCLSTRAQGTFVFDQQSSTESNIGEGAPAIQPNQPFGQSFTPTFSSVGFIRLFLGDSSFNGLGATVSVNLRADSITGSVLGSTEPVFMEDRFSGFVNFLFSNPVTVTPGVTYYFQPVVESGDIWQVASHNAFGYAGGTAFALGQPSQVSDLWFREGIIIPEPSSVVLLLAGFGVLLYAPLAKHLRKRTRDRHEHSG
jgi:hypothetical protein